jgi:hypothetical protein
MILPPPPRATELKLIEIDDKTEVALPAILPIQEGPAWQDLSIAEQSRLVHLLIYPDRPDEEPRNYAGDLNLLRFLLQWANTEDRWFHVEKLGNAIHRRMLVRLQRDHEYGSVISIEAGLSVLEPSDVCYALLEVYGQFRPTIMVPRYREQWYRTVRTA